MAAYGENVERMMRRLFGSLNERDRRRYAAVEAAKLRSWGMVASNISLGCWAAIRRRFDRGLRNWKLVASWLLKGSEKKGRTQTADRDVAAAGGEFSASAA